MDDAREDMLSTAGKMSNSLLLTESPELNVEDNPNLSIGCRSRVITSSFLNNFTVALSCRSAVEVTLKNWFPKSLSSYNSPNSPSNWKVSTIIKRRSSTVLGIPVGSVNFRISCSSSMTRKWAAIVVWGVLSSAAETKKENKLRQFLTSF